MSVEGEGRSVWDGYGVVGSVEVVCVGEAGLRSKVRKLNFWIAREQAMTDSGCMYHKFPLLIGLEDASRV